MRYLQKNAYLSQDGEVVENPLVDELFQENEAITAAATSSIAGKIAFGPNAGKYVAKIGSGFGFLEEMPLAKGKRCYSVNGFSLHCNTAINTHARDRLEKLTQYIARGPLSNERLEITDKGKVKLELKSRWSDGTTHLLFTPEEFLEKLSALIPPPKNHLVRWGGVFAGNSLLRKKIILQPEEKKGFDFDDGEKVAKNSSWAKMLARVFKLDVLQCECGGKLQRVAAIQDRDEIKRYLKHVNLEYDPPARAPPINIQESFDFDQSCPKQESIIYLD